MIVHRTKETDSVKNSFQSFQCIELKKLFQSSIPSNLWQAFCPSSYSSQTCNLQTEFVYMLSALSLTGQTRSDKLSLQVCLEYEDEQKPDLWAQKERK